MSPSRKVSAGIMILIGLAAFAYVIYSVIDVATTPGTRLEASHAVLDVTVAVAFLAGGLKVLRGNAKTPSTIQGQAGQTRGL